MSEEKIRDIGAMGEALGLVSSLLDQYDWDWLVSTCGKADTLGPVLDPTAYMRSMESGTLDRNHEAAKATRDYVRRLRAVFDTAVSGG